MIDLYQDFFLGLIMSTCLYTIQVSKYLDFFCSVASAMQTPVDSRYERLTSVSSSVDFDQRDSVSVNLSVFF